MTDSNKDILLRRLNDLLSKPVYTCLEVYSKGNKVYLLKDSSFRIYILIVPKTPLDNMQSNVLINSGYKELWENVNYERHINYADSISLNQLIDDMEIIFNEVFKVGIDRKWRYDLSTGMAVLKDNKTPLLTASERREISKKRKQRFKGVFNEFTYSLLLSAILFVGLFSGNLVDSLTVRIIVTVFSISFIIIKFGRFITKFQISSFGKKRFLSRVFSDFFEQHGFKKFGERYKGQIHGYSTELMYSELHKNIIIVYHNEISWSRVLKLPKGKAFSSVSYDWTGMFYSQKRINRRLSKEMVLKEANGFVELIINQKI